MISVEEYGKIISELIDELPEPFFRKLSGGVIVSEASAVPEYAVDDDLYTLGQYQVSSGMRQIPDKELRGVKTVFLDVRTGRCYC